MPDNLEEESSEEEDLDDKFVINEGMGISFEEAGCKDFTQCEVKSVDNEYRDGNDFTLLSDEESGEDEEGCANRLMNFKEDVMDVLVLHVGKTFPDAFAFTWAFQKNAITRRIEVNFPISKSNKVIAKCNACGWIAYAS